jgi:hypothetical protein
MPLSPTGKKVLQSMQNEYGPEKGKSVFYASENAKKPGSEKWTLKGELAKRATPKQQAKPKRRQFA